MRNSWTKLDDGTWGARLENFAYAGTAENKGLGVTLTTRAGRKTDVILGDFVRQFRIKGGIIVKVYRVFENEAEYQASLTREHGDVYWGNEFGRQEAAQERAAYQSEMDWEGEMIAREEREYQQGYHEVAAIQAVTTAGSALREQMYMEMEQRDYDLYG